MRKKWVFKKREEIQGCVILLFVVVAFAFSTALNIAMATPGDIRIVQADNTGATNSTVLITGTNRNDISAANSIQIFYELPRRSDPSYARALGAFEGLGDQIIGLIRRQWPSTQTAATRTASAS